jgi:hypothetical protein
MTVTSLEARWIARASLMLRGRRIIEIAYADRGQTRELGWSRRAPVLILEGGLTLRPSCDAEGNDGGALMLSCPVLPMLPPLQLEEYIPRPLRGAGA